MKIKDWFSIAGSILFAWLFYKQGQGINYTIYSFFIIVCLYILSPKAIKQKNWWLAAASVIITSVCMALYASTVAFFGNIISLLLLAAYSVKVQAPAVLNFAQSALNMVLVVPNYFKGLHHTAERKKQGKPAKMAGYGYVYIIVVAVFLIFVLLYSASSKAFSNLLNKIDLTFVSFQWLLMALLGFFITHGLLKHYRLKNLDKQEARWGLPLNALLWQRNPEEENKLNHENKAGILLLALLNVLLLVVNSTDIVFLAEGINTPAEYNFSEMVHQGVGALILSIVFAIIIIMYFFKGQLNFEEVAKPLYILALVWLAQNILLIATGAYKNFLYTHYVDGLTYKRLGVYFYLLLSAIGLVFTAIKIYGKKPNWYLVRANFTAFFIVLLLSCPFDWDVIITRYNIQKAAVENKDPDIVYLLSLSTRNLPAITEWAKDVVKESKRLHSYSAAGFNDILERLQNKSQKFTGKYNVNGWKSWNYTAEENYYYLMQVQWDKLLLPEIEGEFIAPENDYHIKND
jgi:hypothetical protein